MQLRRRSSRAIRTVLVAACGLLVVVAAAVVALHSAPVRHLLLAKILESVNEGIEGRLDAAELEVHLPAFSVRGLALKAPGGRVVATAERIDGIPLWPLVHHRVVLAKARLRGLWISAVYDDRGVDLFEAARRREKQGGQQGGGLELEGLAVDRGAVRVEQRRVPGVAAVFDAELETGWIAHRRRGQPLRITLLGPRLDPVAERFELGLAIHPREEGGAVDVELASRSLDASVRIERAGAGRRVRVPRLKVSPAAGRALVGWWPARVPVEARGEVVARDGRSSAEVAARVGPGHVRMKLEAGHAASGDGPRRLEANLVVEGVDVASVSDREPRIVSGRADVRVEGANLGADARIAAGSGAPLVAMSVRARRLEGGEALRVERLTARIGDVPLELQRPATLTMRDGGVGTDRLVLRSGAISIALWGRVSRERLAAHARVGADAGALARAASALGAAVPPVRGRVTVRLDAGGTTAAPLLALRVASPRLALAALPPIALDATLTSRRSDVLVRGDARVRGARAIVRARVPGPARALLDRARAGGIGSLPFSAIVDVDGTARALPVDETQRLGGTMSLRVVATGTLKSPSAEAHATVEGLGARGSPPMRGDVRATWRDRTGRLDARLSARRGGSVVVSGSVDATRAGALQDAEVSVDARASGFDPTALAWLVPGVERASGTIDGAARVTGSLDAVSASWRLSWIDGRLATVGYGRYGPFRVIAQGDARSATVAVDGGSGGGTFTLRGSARTAGDHTSIQGIFESVRVPLVIASEMRGRISTKISLGGDASRAGADLTARVEHGVVELAEVAGGSVQAIRRPEGVVVGGGGGSDGERERTGPDRDDPGRLSAGGKATPKWRVTVQSAQPVRVKRDDLELRVVTAPTLRIEAADDRILVYGAIRSSSGQVSVSGAEVDAVSGTELRFSGPPEAPFIEIAAARDLDRGGMQVVHGRRPGGDSVQHRRHVQLYSLLSQGRVEPPRSSAHSSVEGRGWGSVLERTFAAQVPLGAFLERGTSSRSSDIRSSVTGQVDVGSVSRLAGDPSQDENRRSVRLGVRLAPRTMLEGTSGDGGVSGIDVIWELLRR